MNYNIVTTIRTGKFHPLCLRILNKIFHREYSGKACIVVWSIDLRIIKYYFFYLWLFQLMNMCIFSLAMKLFNIIRQEHYFITSKNKQKEIINNSIYMYYVLTALYIYLLTFPCRFISCPTINVSIIFTLESIIRKQKWVMAFMFILRRPKIVDRNPSA